MFEMSYRPGEDVRLVLDEAISKLFYTDSAGVSKAWTCLVCDRFTGPRFRTISGKTLESKRALLDEVLDEHRDLPDGLRGSYQYTGPGVMPWMKKYLFSPRAIYKGAVGKRQKRGFVLCTECHYSLTRNAVPVKYIGNGYFFGAAPPELTNLTDNELALLSPVKIWGYCFRYDGLYTKIKGTLAYYKIKPREIARATAVASKLATLLNRNIVYIFTGRMTREQREKLRAKSTVRVGVVRDAVVWLSRNHPAWDGIDIDTIEKEIDECRPVVYDLVDEINAESARDNCETDGGDLESFSVYFPDGTMTSVYGGCENAREFEKTVFEAQKQGFDGDVIASLSPRFCKDYEGNNFTNACLLQFPFGRGGLKERRLDGDGFPTTYLDYALYAQHLSFISNPTFHRPLFVLQLFNVRLRCKILRAATQQLHGKWKVPDLRSELQGVDFTEAVNAKINRQVGGHPTAHKVLRAVDAISRALPNTNEAAKRARQWVEALQHHFNIGGVFLTVTPDDENSFVVAVHSLTEQDGTFTDPTSLSPDELRQRAQGRREVRVKYPGLTALTFGFIMDILIRDVIGWDLQKGEPTTEPGLFGTPIAFAGAVEEQGRTSLHVHFIIWLKGFAEYLRMASRGIDSETRIAENHIRPLVDNGISTELMGFDSSHGLERKHNDIVSAFPHQSCIERDSKKRKQPELVSDQELRYLRDRRCKKIRGNVAFARCPDCHHAWTYEEMVHDYLFHHRGIPLEGFPDNTKLLDEFCYQYTKPCGERKTNQSVVHARYDSHLSTHACSCIKTGGNKEVVHFECECRMRLPALPCPFTSIKPVAMQENGSNEMMWFTWRGLKETRRIVSVEPKRRYYDLFQNASCWPITESKIGGNSNARIVTPGPIGMYSTKYPTKDTQKNDTEPYAPMVNDMNKILNLPPKHENERHESARLLIAAGSSHQVSNVSGPPMASYLTRFESRFVFSHQFVFIPVRDLINLLLRNEIERVYLRSSNGAPYMEVFALHYLCRPRHLRNLSPMRFFEEYEAVRTGTKRRSEEEHEFVDTAHFIHGSHIVNPKTGKSSRCMVLRKRYQRRLAWVSQYEFPDTASFGGRDILTCPFNQITEDMENYALHVVVLCSSYTCLDDIQIENSFVRKLRDLYKRGFIREYEDFLENLQDSRANFGRVRPCRDELQLRTMPLKAARDDNDAKGAAESDDEEDVKDHKLQGEELDAFLRSFEAEVAVDSQMSHLIGVKSKSFIPDCFNTSFIRHRGGYSCGVRNLCHIDRCDATLWASPPPSMPNYVDLHGLSPELIDEQTATLSRDNQTDHLGVQPVCRAPLTRADVVQVMFVRDKRRRHIPSLFKENETREFDAANGTAVSIINWGRICEFDEEQQRSFEIFVSSFVLTVYDETPQDSTNRTRSVTFLKERIRLLKLAGRIAPTASRSAYKGTHENSLIGFLHGPGGSGKSAIIEVLVEYAKEYCEHTNIAFDCNTIKVTAMSGVAASLIGGQTTHLATHFRSTEKNLLPFRTEWEATRLLIIDEISFASQEELISIEKAVCILRDNRSDPYGGLNVIFCGDLRQLEPCNGTDQTLIHSLPISQFHGALNCYLELKGLHRFKKDMEWGRILSEFREGRLTEKHIDTINTRVVKSGTELPRNLQYATYMNRDRASINMGLFEKSCHNEVPSVDNCVVVLSSDLSVCNGSGVYKTKDNAFESWFWEQCGEGDCKPEAFQGRFDPALILYPERPVMVNTNENVKEGVANGTRARVVKVHLKKGVVPRGISLGGGVVISAVRAHQVEKITLRHEKEDIKPREFDLKPQPHRFHARVPVPESIRPCKTHRWEYLKMTGIQLPIVCNSATTVHKLQGASVDSVFIHSWTKLRNWVYVALSRVKTLDGLFLRSPLSKSMLKQYNDIARSQLNMINDFKKTKTKYKTPLSDEQYEAVFYEDIGFVRDLKNRPVAE